MQRGDHREDHAEQAQSAGQHEVGPRQVKFAEQEGKDERDGREAGAPEPGLRHFAAQSVVAAADQRRGRGLHGAVADGPEREEARDLDEFPAAGVEEYRQADDEPHVAGAEQEDAGGGHQVDGGGFGE